MRKQVIGFILKVKEHKKYLKYLIIKIINIHGSWTVGLTTSIRKILRNPLYIGKIFFEGEVYDGKHEPIIDTNTFEEVQKMIERKQKTYKSTLESHHLLVGLIYCANCNARYMVNTISSKGRKYKYYLSFQEKNQTYYG